MNAQAQTASVGLTPVSWTHDALAQDLAKWLRLRYQRLTWENLSFACDKVRRPDVFSLIKTLSVGRTRPWVHEIKVSRGDFRADLRTGKWQQHARYACRIYFACPEGLISPDELPPGAGLIVRRAQHWDRWQLLKAPAYQKGWELKHEDLMRLILGRWGTKPEADVVGLHRDE